MMKWIYCGWVSLSILLGIAGPAKADFLYTTLDPLGSTRTQAVSINDPGDIVGSFRDDVASLIHGFLLSGGSYTTLDPLGSILTVAMGINNPGQVVGNYQDGGGTFHGFLLSGGDYTTLDAPGSAFTVGGGINDAGQIVGFYSNARLPETGDNFHGFLLNGSSYTTLDVPGSTSTQAFSISNTGQIVGTYDDASGVTHGFLATFAAVPEPSTWLLIGIGLATLGATQWRQRKAASHAF